VSYDWKNLRPGRPLDPGETKDDLLYVDRAGAVAAGIDLELEAGLDQPVALFGPAGAGKSTELAALAARRRGSTLVRLDRILRPSETTTVDDVLGAIATEVSKSAGIGPHEVVAVGGDRLHAVARRFRASGKPDPTVLIDGLEKASSGLAHRTITRLLDFRYEAKIVVVIPIEVSVGPSAHILSDYRLMPVGPVPVVEALNPDWAETWKQLFWIVGRRLGVADHLIGRANNDLAPAMGRAVQASGGLVRTYLQLLQTAALHATLRGADVPREEDVRRAEADQTAFLLRLLKEGDAEALRAAHGTAGLEVETTRKVRFLANALLLEYASPAGSTLRVTPLLHEALKVHDG
jgi:hypothetical protein